MKWTSLPGYAQTTFILVQQYLDKWGGECFTYKGLRNYIFYDREVKGRFEWHSIERGVRKLAEEDVLKRARKGRKVIFCKGKNYNIILHDYREILRSIAYNNR